MSYLPVPNSISSFPVEAPGISGDLCEKVGPRTSIVPFSTSFGKSNWCVFRSSSVLPDGSSIFDGVDSNVGRSRFVPPLVDGKVPAAKLDSSMPALGPCKEN